jgi:PAS domain S-box-containing protein
VAIAIASLEEGYLLDANEAYWKLTGFAPSFAIGKTTVELGSWNTASERAKFVQRIKQEKSIYNPGYEIRNQSGETGTALAFYELIDFESQPAVLAMYYDITEQKNAQVALQASEQKYRNFIEQSMEGIWFLNFDQPIPTSLPAEEQVELIYKYGYIAECNDVLARMYGYNSSAEMRGVRLLDVETGEELTRPTMPH